MQNTIIIHKHSNGCGGIGDFIRASLSFYSLCTRLGYKYYIDFEENPYMNECFITEKIPEEIRSYPNETFILLHGLYDLNKMSPYLEKFKNEKKVYYIKSNAIGFEEIKYIIEIKDYYFKNILVPSEKVNNIINDIYEKYNLSEKNYVSFHFRCGDKFISDITNNRSDNRINLENTNIFENTHNIIKNHTNKLNINIPIIIHSDSQQFKNKLKELTNDEYIFLDLEIKHIAENLGTNTEEGYISTIVEFYILSKASFIISPISYSGFCHISSLINNIKLYSAHNHHLYYLHNDNIVII